ncbi:hypothetical protein FACS189415_1370 [Bacteroidia bacterium]|nr:hypothetical protein FACS189415_1370 [Bacteroidia bacterium]
MGVRPAELSNATGIDKTLISRWKNGHRRLTPGSAYARSIAAYLVTCDQEQGLLLKTLQGYGLDETTGSLEQNLAFWLSEQPLPTPSIKNASAQAPSGPEYTASFNVYLGNQGLCSALITLLDYVMSMREPGDVLMVIGEHPQWLSASTQVLNTLIERLHQAFARGITLNVILREGVSIQSFSHLAGLWLEAHLRKNIRSFRYPQTSALAAPKLECAAQGGACLKISADTEAEDGFSVGLFTDHVTVRQAHALCKSYQNAAKPRFHKDYLEQPDGALQALDPGAAASSDTYIFSPVPGLGTISIERLREHTHLSRQENRELCAPMQPLLYTPDVFAPSTHVRHVYCLESIEQILLQGRHLNAALSGIAGRHIYHVKKRLQRQLKDMHGWLCQNKNYEVAFLPKRHYDRIPIAMVSSRYHYAVAWLHDSVDSICVTEEARVEAVSSYAQSMWQGIPQYFKSHSKTLRQIEQWLEE